MEPKRGDVNDKNVDIKNSISNVDKILSNDVNEVENVSKDILIKNKDDSIVSNDENIEKNEIIEDNDLEDDFELKINNSEPAESSKLDDSSTKNGDLSSEYEAKESEDEDKLLLEGKGIDVIESEGTIEETIIITNESDNSQDTNNMDTDSVKDNDTNPTLDDDEEITETIIETVIEYTEEEINPSMTCPSESPESPDPETAVESSEDKTVKDSKKLDDKIPDQKKDNTDGALENKSSSENLKSSETSSNTDKRRSVIEDIYDDWKDENPDEECGSTKSHDEVEQKLKNLLDEDNKQVKIDNEVEATSPVKKPAPNASKLEEDSKTTQSVNIKSKKISASSSVKLEKKFATPKAKAKSTDLKSSPVTPNAETPKTVKGIKSKDGESTPKELVMKKKVKQSDSATKTGNSLIENEKGENKNTDKELIDILEGDVDPDWSNLKSASFEQAKTSSNLDQSHVPKLDPVLERELAMKQLLELPPTPKKPKEKIPKVVKNKIGKETPKQVLKKVFDETVKQDSKEVAKQEPKTISVETADVSDSDKNQEVKTEETRSGRKRKPTEKAREHEFIAKRHKFIKAKPSPKKSLDSIPNTELDASMCTPVVKLLKEIPKEPVVEKKETVEVVKNSTSEKESKSAEPESKKTAEEAKESPAKKIGQKQKNIKPKLSVKKTPVKTFQKKEGKVLSKNAGKKNSETKEVETKEIKLKKKNNEIDRLLQDEGVVNLLYDVEQPRRRRLVPVTQSQVKVMDMQKVKRELKIRTKLVKNAVLRLRTSGTAASPISPRSTRLTSLNQDQETEQSTNDPTEEKQKSSDSMKSPRSSVSSQNEFIIPAKIRNAKESVIIRRHSSSSFSSASGSPRVSFDGGEKIHLNEVNKMDENHPTRSNKRRLSQEDKKKQMLHAKKIKKEVEEKPVDSVKNKATNKSIKKVENKKVKNIKQEIEEKDESSSTAVNTRSNGTTEKNKRLWKNKVTFVEESEETGKNHDDEAESSEEISENPPNRGKPGRKPKIRAPDADRIKDKSTFSNKEINVQRHGNLVQLIMTPSTTCKIKNAITLQMMQEFRDVLSILKKDDECKVVLFTSTGTSFCGGLDLSSILQENKDARRNKALELANSVKDFIKSLATFNKPIVAGVQGTAVGLGVTILPLFDLVIASDKATFSTPYRKLGQVAEGAAAFTLSHIIGIPVTSELLLGSRILTANEALRAGLVTRVLWPDSFQVELLPSLRAMSEESSQSMEATKALLRHSLRKKLDAALESESYILVQHWCSTECQEAIKNYMDELVQ